MDRWPGVELYRANVISEELLDRWSAALDQLQSVENEMREQIAKRGLDPAGFLELSRG